MEKRGVSSLVIGVLLVAFVITVFVVMSTYIQKTTEQATERTTDVLDIYRACNDIRFNIEKAYCNEAQDLLVIKVVNNQNIDFDEGFSIFTISDEGKNKITTFLYGTQVLAGETKEISALRRFDVDETTGEKVYFEIKEVEVVPKVKIGENVKMCIDQRENIEVENCLAS